MAEVTVPLESMGVSNEELFAGAIGNEPPAVKEEQVAQPNPQQERVRDEQGRFAKVEAQPEKPAQEQPVQAVPEQPKADAKPDVEIPSWRLRELREARDNEAKRAQDAETRASQLEAQLRQFMAQQHQQQNPPPDIFQDPNKWQEHLAQQFDSRLDSIRFSMSEEWARDKFGDQKVDEALKWAGTNLGQPERVRVNSARSPYRELVRLYDERQTLQQIGGDLNAYRAKLSDELLNDPAFMQKVAEKLRGQAPANGQRPAVNLPPSLNKATGMAGNIADTMSDADMSNAALFAHATAR